jgi:hypothetical protein
LDARLPAGRHFLTPTVSVHVLEAAEPGPTALVQGGIHGDEIAGIHAVEELLEEGLAPVRGRLLLIPCMNPAAYRAGQRTATGGLDLNRQFPGDLEAAEPERRAAARFTALTLAERPALMLTLHESWKRFHPELPVSFGQTVVYGVEPRPPLVDALVAGMNAALEAPYELWAPHYFPVATSSTEMLVEMLGPQNVTGLCIETWMGFERARRVAMHKRIVRLALREVGLLDAV